MSSIVLDMNRVSEITTQDDNLCESPRSSHQDENILEKLKKAAQDGDVEQLYKLIGDENNILDQFDKVSFCETPLHVAAEEGQTHFAMELATLKPSFALKLDASGSSPLHLAVQNNHNQTARGLVSTDSSLVSIKGRGRITPLHQVARIGDAQLLSELLFACPSSIEDLTIKRETAMHIAVKNHQIMAFKVLLGWVKRVNREDILDWKDEDGNTVFHIAASINHTEVMKLLCTRVKVTAKNLDGKTAMDILRAHQHPCFPEATRLLHRAKERLVCPSTTTLADYLSKNLSFIEKQKKLLGLRNVSMTRDRSPNTSNRRDAILVVAILIVTATCQAALSPPGGFWQEDSYGNGNDHLAGQMVMPFRNAVTFLGLTGFAFLLSLYVILVLITGLPVWRVIYGSTAALGVAISASYGTLFPTLHENNPIGVVPVSVLTYGFPLIVGSMILAILTAFIVDKRRRQRVDFPGRCFSASLP